MEWKLPGKPQPIAWTLDDPPQPLVDRIEQEKYYARKKALQEGIALTVIVSVLIAPVAIIAFHAIRAVLLNLP